MRGGEERHHLPRQGESTGPPLLPKQPPSPAPSTGAGPCPESHGCPGAGGAAGTRGGCTSSAPLPPHLLGAALTPMGASPRGAALCFEAASGCVGWMGPGLEPRRVSCCSLPSPGQHQPWPDLGEVTQIQPPTHPLLRTLCPSSTRSLKFEGFTLVGAHPVACASAPGL